MSPASPPLFASFPEIENGNGNGEEEDDYMIYFNFDSEDSMAFEQVERRER